MESALRLRRPYLGLLFHVLARIWSQRRLPQLEVGRRPRLWVHPIVRQRQQKGHFVMLYGDLRRYPDKFGAFTRISVEAFDHLLNLLRPSITKKDTVMRTSISAEQRLLITLRFLATGETYASLHLQFRVGKTTISIMVKETCQAIWEILQPLYLQTPTPELWLAAADGFAQKTQFPNCIGAVDGIHIRVRQPHASGSRFINYKKYFSIVLMAVADSNYCFLAIDVGAYGSTSDSRVLKSSAIGRQILNNQVSLPPPQPLPGNDTLSPFVMVADEAFPLMHHLLRPYPRRGLNLRRRLYNQRLSSARKYVECTFGILVSKWRVFTSAIQLQESIIDHVSKACCVLHNFVLKFDRPEIDVEEYYLTGDFNLNIPCVRSSNTAVLVREEFTDYFARSAASLHSQAF